MDVMLLYITAPDAEKAKSLGHSLLQERLAACVNIYGPVTSLYRWEGKLCEETEYTLFAKTPATLAQQAVARIAELHPYQCPCVVALPVAEGHPPFLSWVYAETSDSH